MKSTLSGLDEMKNNERKPEMAYEFTYWYYYPKGKISQINLNFTDSSRKISIEGTDPTQVDALFSMLKEKFENRSSFFGGDSFRVLLLFGIFFPLIFYSVRGFEISNKTGLTRLIFPICIVAGLFVLVEKFGLFLGTAIYSGDASFIVRNSAHLSFWGLVFTTALPFFLPYLRKEKPKASSPIALTNGLPPMQIPAAPTPTSVEKGTKTEMQTIEDTKNVERERTPLELKVIYTKLKEAPPAQLQEVTKTYYGIWVRCTGQLMDVAKIQDKEDLAKVSVEFAGGYITTTVSFSKYPALAFLPNKHPILIVGRISEITGYYRFQLVDATLSYDQSNSNGKIP